MNSVCQCVNRVLKLQNDMRPDERMVKTLFFKKRFTIDKIWNHKYITLCSLLLLYLFLNTDKNCFFLYTAFL